MKLSHLLLFHFLLILFPARAQTFGDEWIDYNQQYYKLYIGEEGLYRLTFEDLNNAGLPLNKIDPRGMQIFWRGQEQHIWVQGESDGSFDPGDYIVFYGTYNDGKLDTELYQSPKEQPHTYMSLYQDSSVYFITWNNNKTGKRIAKQAQQDFTGLTPDPWYMHEEVMWFRNQWFDGAPFADLGFYSEYTEGEGWMSSNVTGGYRSYSLQTPFYDASGPQAKASILAFGKSDPTNPGDFDPEGNNHEFEVSVGWSNTLSVIATRKHRGYSRLEFNDMSIPANAIGSTTRFNFRSIFGAKGRHAVSLIRLRYPRKFNLGGQSWHTFKYSGTNQFMEWSNYPASLTQPIVIDLSNNEILFTSLENRTLKYKMSNVKNNKIVILDSSNVKTIHKLFSVNFINYSLIDTTIDFTIISHTKLREGAIEYENYRESASGGSHNVFVAFADELYDQFSHGIHHPLALNTFIKKFIKNRPVEYLLLLGRGRAYFNYTNDPDLRQMADLVPTAGYPCSDLLLFSEINNFQPFFGIGRIPALNNSQIIAYLDKVKEHETIDYTDFTWKKNIIQLTGGYDKNENALFNSYQDGFARVFESQPFGGRRIRFSKFQSISIDQTQEEQIQNAINQGAAMVNYFGHGSATVLELSIGDVKTLNNKGKYPLFYFNGCALGNVFDNQSLGEQFLFEPGKGTIFWIAGSSFQFTSELFNYCNIFNQELFTNNYNSTLGKVIQATLSKYQRPNNPYNRSMSRQFLYIGDPALKIFSPNQPEFVLDCNPKVDDYSHEDSIFINISFTNIGKTGQDSIAWQLFTQEPTGNQIINSGTAHSNSYEENIQIAVRKLDFNFSGNKSFMFTLNGDQRYKELLNSENRCTFIHKFRSSKGTPLYPIQHQIITAESLNFIFTIDNLPNGEISIEIDTTPTFNSDEYRSLIVSNPSSLNIVQSQLPPFNNIDFFWRIKTPDGLSEIRSFAYMYKESNGVSQFHDFNFAQYANSLISYDSIKRSFDFNRITSTFYEVHSTGANVTSVRNLWIGDATYMAYDEWWNGKGIRMLFLNPDNEERLMYNSKFNLTVKRDWFSGIRDPNIASKYYVIGEKSGLFEFNTTIKEHRDSLIDFLNTKVPKNFHVFIYNGTSLGISSWEDELFNTFEKVLGMTHIRQLKDGHPFIVASRIGAKPGEATEILPDYSSPQEAESQFLARAFYINPKLTEVSFHSELFGPARVWSAFEASTLIRANDSVTYDIIGIDNKGDEFVLFRGLNGEKKDLSNIDASIYPYLKVRFKYFDNVDRTAPQPEQLSLYYRPVPEGIAFPTSDENKILSDVNPFVVERGDSIRVYSVFTNISDESFDSVTVLVTLNKPGQTPDTLLSSVFPELQKNENIFFNYLLETRNLSGNYDLKISFNSSNQVRELDLSNNLVVFNINVNQEKISPIIDLLFDNQRISNGQLVSPNSKITLIANDNNDFFHIDDPALFDVKIKQPSLDSFIDIMEIMDEVRFQPETENESARLEYRADKLDNGIYTLTYNVRDQSGNKAAADDLTVNFEIINERSVSNLLFYPNPFTTESRITFFITGDVVPDQILINIHNISGRKVKTIDLASESLKIGFNLTEYRWNGTDDFGDQLANGVYFYTVETRHNGKSLILNNYVSNDFFEENVGKLYIMR